MKALTKTFTLIAFILLTASLAYGDRETRMKETTEEALRILKDTDSKLNEWFDDAYGYALFPTVGKVGFGFGAAFGKGEVYEKGKFIGEARVTQASIGFQLGGQAYIEIIFFKKKDNVDNFMESRFALSAKVSGRNTLNRTN